MKNLLRPLLLCALLLCATAQAQMQLQVKTAAPWSLKTPDGATVNFPADAHGQPTLLLFWPSWCPYSRALQPYVQDIWRDYRDAGVHVWTINILEKGDPVQVMKDRGLSFPLLLNGDPLRETYGIVRTPWLVVIDGHSNIVYTRPPDAPGPIEVAKDARKALNALLGEHAVPLPTSYPPPYDLHLRKPGDQPSRLAPAAIPAAQADAWVQQYLAGVGADERVADFPGQGAVSKGADAIARARDAWTQVYGADRVASQAPYRAYRRNDRWVVLGQGLDAQLGKGLILVLDAGSGAVVRMADSP